MPEVSDMLVSYRTIVHHIGYIVKEEGKIVESDFVEIGPILNANEYYILPIKAANQCFVTVALSANQIRQVFYLGESLEYMAYKVESSEAVICCSFLLDDLNIDTNDIQIEY